MSESSRTFVTIPILHVSIGDASRLDRLHNALDFTDESVRHTNALILFCVQRPGTSNHLSLFEYTTKHHLSKTADASLQLSAPVPQFEIASRRPVDAVVFIRARIEAAKIESVSKAMLYVHLPWRSLNAIFPLCHDPAAVLNSAAD